jgi:hypothetical protein
MDRVGLGGLVDALHRIHERARRSVSFAAMTRLMALFMRVGCSC